ncbi:MAG TPA: wax ester/triacylglycerol synthase domain-containing protein [Marmoricola sp.]|nr:wax ester/triacylglycerol synthase domain-containing protein [Marmoricola sp.]
MMSEFMRNTDAFSWAMEHDPRLRSTVVTILVFDQSPDWGVVRSRFERLARTVPMFRRRVRATVPLAPPRWEDDPDFDLDYHLRRVEAPAPHTLDTVLDMARRAEMADFDRARPLWEATLVEGLDGGEAALLVKMHHALSDGVGAMQIAMILFDLEAHPAGDPLAPVEPETVSPSAPGGLRQLASYDARQLLGLSATVVRHGPRLAWAGLRQPVGTLRSGIDLAASVYRTVRPIARTGSPLMRKRSMVRKLGVHEVPLDGLRAAARSTGSSLNDAFLAGVTGGLRRYHEKHATDVDELHVTMPVSIRCDGDPVGGNRITLMRFDLPTAVADPGERIRRVHERASRVRHEASLPYTQQIAGALNLVPRWYIGSVLRHVDFLASDVPGIPVRVYLGGAAMRSQYAFGPTIGAAVNITLVSYAGTCSFGINVDSGAIPDFEVFHECLVAGFDEVLALAG